MRVLRRVAFPRSWLLLTLALFSSVLLALVFYFSLDTHPAAYIVFALSAYSLTAICVRICVSWGGIKTATVSFIDRIPLTSHLRHDSEYRVRFSLRSSFWYNALYAVFKLVFGYYLDSIWFVALGVYYLLLAAMRFLLMRYAARADFGSDIKGELVRYHVCGVILLVMNAALAVVVALIVRDNNGFAYPGYLIYVMALYAFYNVISAVAELIKYRRYKSPVISATKLVKLAVALVSMLALETAMLSQFSTGAENEGFRLIMTACTGAGVCTVIFAFAVYMIVHAAREMRKEKR